MHRRTEWAEVVSSKVWSAPIVTADNERLKMEVEWEGGIGFRGYLTELWQGIKALSRRIHLYTKLKQG
jgi:hypothetical protein